MFQNRLNHFEDTIRYMFGDCRDFGSCQRSEKTLQALIRSTDRDRYIFRVEYFSFKHRLCIFEIAIRRVSWIMV